MGFHRFHHERLLAAHMPSVFRWRLSFERDPGGAIAVFLGALGHQTQHSVAGKRCPLFRSQEQHLPRPTNLMTCQRLSPSGNIRACIYSTSTSLRRTFIAKEKKNGTPVCPILFIGYTSRRDNSVLTSFWRR